MWLWFSSFGFTDTLLDTKHARPERFSQAGTLPGQILNAHQWTPCSLDITPKEIPHQGFCDPMCKDGLLLQRWLNALVRF